MKIISQLLLIVFTVTALAACDNMGKGPSKPTTPNPASPNPTTPTPERTP